MNANNQVSNCASALTNIPRIILSLSLICCGTISLQVTAAGLQILITSNFSSQQRMLSLSLQITIAHLLPFQFGFPMPWHLSFRLRRIIGRFNFVSTFLMSILPSDRRILGDTSKVQPPAFRIDISLVIGSRAAARNAEVSDGIK